MRARRTLSREFKREAASMVLDQGFKVMDVCLTEFEFHLH